jgi:hypothetical protein
MQWLPQLLLMHRKLQARNHVHALSTTLATSWFLTRRYAGLTLTLYAHIIHTEPSLMIDARYVHEAPQLLPCNQVPIH